MTLADKINEALTRTGMSLADVNIAIGSEYSMVNRLRSRNNLKYLDYRTAVLMSATFQVPLDYWIDDDLADEIEATRITAEDLRRTKHREIAERKPKKCRL